MTKAGKWAGLVIVAILLAACSATSAPSASSTVPQSFQTEAPIPSRTPDPTASPVAAFNLRVSTITYTGATLVGGPITIDAKVTNLGKVDEPSLQFQMSDIDQYAEVVGCKPACSVTNLFGLYAAFKPGVKAGKTMAIHIELIATKVGAPLWSTCVYDSAEMTNNQVACSQGLETIIR